MAKKVTKDESKTFKVKIVIGIPGITLNVRKSPSIRSDVITKVEDGHEFLVGDSVTADGYEWYHVASIDGIDGYIISDYAQKMKAAKKEEKNG